MVILTVSPPNLLVLSEAVTRSDSHDLGMHADQRPEPKRPGPMGCWLAANCGAGGRPAGGRSLPRMLWLRQHAVRQVQGDWGGAGGAAHGGGRAVAAGKK